MSYMEPKKCLPHGGAKSHSRYAKQNPWLENRLLFWVGAKKISVAMKIKNEKKEVMICILRVVDCIWGLP